MGRITVGIVDPQTGFRMQAVQLLADAAAVRGVVDVQELVATCVKVHSSSPMAQTNGRGQAEQVAFLMDRASNAALVDSVLDVGAQVEITFDDVNFHSLDEEQRSGAFGSFPAADHVVLRRGLLPQAAFEEFCIALRSYTDLESLALLPGSTFSATSLAPLSATLARHCRLRSFGLRVPLIGDKDVQGLAAALARCSRMEGIYLDVAELSATAAAALAESLCAMPLLEEIAIGRGCATLDRALVEALPKLRMLRHLQLDAELDASLQARLAAVLCRIHDPKLRTITNPGLSIREALNARLHWSRIIPTYDATIAFIESFDQVKCWFGPHHHDVVAPLAFLRTLQQQRFSILSRFLLSLGRFGPARAELRPIRVLRSKRRLLELSELCARLLELPQELWRHVLEFYLGGIIHCCAPRKRKAASGETTGTLQRSSKRQARCVVLQ